METLVILYVKTFDDQFLQLLKIFVMLNDNKPVLLLLYIIDQFMSFFMSNDILVHFITFNLFAVEIKFSTVLY